ncbi:MAG: hypothetical protein RL557_982 [archaeon]|jgi:hypothetical protein
MTTILNVTKWLERRDENVFIKFAEIFINYLLPRIYKKVRFTVNSVFLVGLTLSTYVSFNNGFIRAKKKVLCRLCSRAYGSQIFLE